jgi:hypothetical protein
MNDGVLKTSRLERTFEAKFFAMAIILRSVRYILDGAVEFFSTHTGDEVVVSDVVRRELNEPEPHLGQDRRGLNKDHKRVERSIDRNLRLADVEAGCNG